MKRIFRLLVEFLLDSYALLFARKSLFKLNLLLFQFSLRGMGVLNYKNDKLSGEDFFIKKISKMLNGSIVIDVGANIGNYSNRIRNSAKDAKIYSIEPHPTTFKKLKSQSFEHNYSAFNIAFGDTDGELQLYDYESKDGSSHASLYQGVFSEIHKSDSVSHSVQVTTLDAFVKNHDIDEITLLKIDTEGNELKVLLGAKQLITNKLVDVIHLEFNEMNVFSRVFFHDLQDILRGYCMYRMLPSGLLKLSNYSPILYEIFAYQNIVAIRKDKLNIIGQYINIE